MFKISKRLLSLGDEFYSQVNPSILSNPELVHVNQGLKKDLDLDDIDNRKLCNWLSGIENIVNYQPIATVYSGHQFGVYVPQLGDGRALIVAEHQDSKGTIWELQLKGSGKTPYSRMGDGLAVLRSSIREYLGSHALDCLGIPTTKALAIINSSTKAYREHVETAASILRVSPTFIRFGHFEFWAHQGNAHNVRKLVDFVSREYFPDLQQSDKYIPEFLKRVVDVTAKLIAKWQAIGFVHGVLNSDNMSILGLSLDYGPYAFMDNFRPDHAYNHSDQEGRYVYANQPQIGLWNLCRLADSLTLIYSKVTDLEEVLSGYAIAYNNYYLQSMANKLGIFNYNKDDFFIIEDWLKIMFNHHMDWTYSWRNLSKGIQGKDYLQQIYKLGQDFTDWYQIWHNRIISQNKAIDDVYKLMQNTNPALVPRTHLLQNAIAKAQNNDYSEVGRLFDALSTPYEELPQFHNYYQLPPTDIDDVVLSCSS
ncbi:MAG: protein adenylyltransferase SelO [Neisseriaceae bacterium]|jgi:uncharacterized protein YdiU (UPF0061 family)